MSEPVDDAIYRKELPLRISSPGNGSHGSWKRESGLRKRQRGAVSMLCGELRALCNEPATPFRIVLTRIGPRLLDDDNLRGAFKSIRDEVAALLDRNDGARSGLSWEYAQERRSVRRGVPAFYAVRIEVYR